MKAPKCSILLIAFIVKSLIACGGYVLKNSPSTRKRNNGSSSFRVTKATASKTDHEDSSFCFTDFLLDYLRRNDTSAITVEGYVLSKRSLGKQLMFCDFQTSSGELVQTMVRQDYFSGSNYAGYKRCLFKGAKLQLIGIASPTRNPGNVVLMIQSMKLLELPRQIQHIEMILQQAKDCTIPIEEVQRACHLQLQEQPLLLNPQSDDVSEKRWLKALAKDIFASLPEDKNYPKAADQRELAKTGNFILPKAPKEWQTISKALSQTNNSTNPKKGTVQEILLQLQQGKDDCKGPFSVSGWVQNRRRFQDDIATISLVDNLTLLSQDNIGAFNVATDRLTCLVHPKLLHDAALYLNLLSVGCKVWVQGNTHFSEFLGKPILWVNQIRLVQCSPRSETIRQLLDLFYEHRLGAEEVTEALLLPKEELYLEDATERQWMANKLAVRLQEAESTATQSSVVKPELLAVLKNYEAYTNWHPVIPTNIMIDGNNEEESEEKCSNPSSLNKNLRMMMPATGMPGSKWQSKKRPQLEWMGHRIRSVLQSHPDYGKRKLSILDIGGGKGQLANYLGKAMSEGVKIHVVDICEGAIANGEQKAKRLNIPVDFQLADASNGSALKDVQADVVVALHACGHLSDVALAHAIQRRAGFVIVPCCFNSNPHLEIPSLSPLIKKESVSEWLGIPAEDWSSLKLLAEVQGDIPLASKAIGILCAVRVEAARKKLLLSSSTKGQTPAIKILTFPIQYSTRNTVLVGLCS